MSEPTITIGDKTRPVSELVEVICDDLLGACLAKGDALREAFKRAVAASRHNADLLEALEDGADFRIAFRKKDETKWTRIVVKDGDALQRAAKWEIVMRQDGMMATLADLLGVDDFSIDNI